MVKAAHAAGVPARRVALAGAADLGDVHLYDGRVVVEVKGGRQCERPSWQQLTAWWAQAEEEAARVPAADMAVLVVRRFGSGDAADWHAYVRVDELLWLTHRIVVEAPWVVSLPLGRLLRLLAGAVVS